jgi:pyrimidine-specific ribonucleoside hydrolase
VHLIALGPLTNVAEALEADPTFTANVQAITIMGGAVNVPGNVRLALDNGNEWAEWNIYADPHAAALVFASGAPITLVPLDATQYAPATLDFYHRLGQDRTTPAAEFIHRVLTQKENDLRAGWYYFWDALTAAIVTDESLATFQDMSLVAIDDEGPQSGRTAVSDGGHTVRVATFADQARFEALFLDALNGR